MSERTDQTDQTRHRSGRPQFTGITSCSDPDGRYEFRHPAAWSRFDLADGGDGVVVRPEPDEPATYFAVVVSDLGESVVADDQDLLRSGFDEGIGQLADLVVEDAADTTYNDIVKLDRTITFTEDGITRKRHVWVLYADHWQLIVAAQGSTVEEYHYWLPMANYCFATFQLPHALWFATDPTVNVEPSEI